jgi:membrane-bound ClpP family serine protease
MCRFLVIILTAWIGAAGAAARGQTVKLLEPPARITGGGTYSLIKVEGEIGAQFNDELLRKCLEQHDKLGVRRLVLEINSDGGLVAEEQKIMRTLVDWQTRRKQKATAVVTGRALSAAGMIAMSCGEIYMKDGSTLGAATAVRVGGGSRLGAVDEKFASARRATIRALVDQAGHDGRLAEAMVDMGVELWLEPGADGKARLVTGQERRAAKGGSAGARRIDASNKLLTLTSREAVEIGLARRLVTDTADALSGSESQGAAPEPTILAMVARHQAAARAVIADYERQVRSLNLAIERFGGKTAGGKPLTRTELQGAQLAVTRVIRLERENPWLSWRVSRDFSGPPQRLLDALKAAEKALTRN